MEGNVSFYVRKSKNVPTLFFLHFCPLWDMKFPDYSLSGILNIKPFAGDITKLP